MEKSIPDDKTVKDFLISLKIEAGKKGIDYADFRYVHQAQEIIQVRNGRLSRIFQDGNSGVGIRVLSRGAWGFAATCNITVDALSTCLEQAQEAAHASALTATRKIHLDNSPPYRDSYHSPCEIDPFQVDLEQKLELLFRCDEILRQKKKICSTRSSLAFYRTDKFFVNTEGAEIQQTIIESGAELRAMAHQDGETQWRSYPNSLGPSLAARGFEYIQQLNLLEGATQAREEALLLLKARPCPHGYMDVIIDSSQLALQIHESCGHPVELDRVLGSEISYAGSSFLTIDKLGKLQYGSPLVNIVADATIPGSIGSFGYDDEGVKAQRKYLIKNGLFVGYLTSRETAPLVNENSSGAMRAAGWNHIPLIRMVNINLEAGSGNLDDLIADTPKGVFLQTNRSWSIDDLRLNFQFGTEIAWLIEKGKLVEPLKNPLYTGITPQFWAACDAICGPEEWQIWGVGNCGKGEPPQTMHVAHGTAPARFRKIEIGFKK